MADFEYTVVRRSRRKTVSIMVHPDNRIVVAAPAFATEAQVAEIVGKKSAWIEKRLKINEETACLSGPPLQFVTGEEIRYLGRKFRLEVEEEKEAMPPTAENGVLRVRVSCGLSEEARRKAVIFYLKKWFVQRAIETFRERIGVFSPSVGAGPCIVRVKNLKSRWGSCSSCGDINLNWKLILTHPDILDYVVVHELCHLVHHDHSAAFWNLVGSVLPDYRERRRRLRDDDRICARNDPF